MTSEKHPADSSPPPPSKRPRIDALNTRAVMVHTQDISLQKELRVGIATYVNPDTAGFSGILKQRYTDFLVNEILPGGEVCRIRTLGDEAVREKIKSIWELKDKHEEKREQSAEKRAEDAEENIKTDVALTEGANASTSEKVVAQSTEPVKESETVDSQEVLPEQKTENGDGTLDQSASKDQQEVNPAQNAPDESQAARHDPTDVSPDSVAKLNELFGERAGAILRLNANVVKHPDWKARDFSSIKTSKIEEKARRTEAHQAIREIFQDRLETFTEKDGSITVKVLPPGQRGQGGGSFHGGRGGRGVRDRGGRGNFGRNSNDRNKPRGKVGWAELGGEHLHFTLYKENKDTMESIAFLAHQLKVPAKNFQFAGTKDRRGVTTQRVCVKRIHAEHLSRLGRTLRNAQIGDFEYRSEGLDLGDLSGNEFVITLRDCHFPGEENLPHEEVLKLGQTVVSKAVSDLTKHGFINYYGLQRFGTFSASTDEIGVKLLQEDFGGAVDKILEFNPSMLDVDPEAQTSNPISTDDLSRAKAINIWRTTGESDKALQILPRKFSAEAGIIRTLSSARRAQDFQGALMTISRNLRMMYVHAYQSLVFNAVASKRWELFGNKVVEGDLVLVNEHKDKEATEGSNADVVDQAGEEVVLPAVDDRAANQDDHHERARALSAEEAASGQYSIFDVVLSLPGWDVEYPRNAIGSFYEEFMGSERGGKLDPHKMQRPWKEVSLTGGYRKLLGRPGENMQGEVREYTGVDAQLVETDMEKLMKSRGQSVDPRMADKAEGVDVQEDKKLAVILKMQLGTSMYATMALRELMKNVKTYKPEYSGRN